MEAALAGAQSKPLACEMCDNFRPVGIACVECQKWICAPCQRIHDQVAGTKYHNLISMETSTYKAREEEADGHKAVVGLSRAFRRKVCKVHAEKELIFHCCVCDVIICTICVEASHRGHATEDLDVASERIRAEVRELLGKLEVKVKAVAEVTSEVSRTEQELERQRQAVISEAVEAAGKVSAWANQAEDNLVKEVNKMADPVKDNLLKQKTAAREVTATLVLQQDRAKLVMKTGTYTELQSLRSDLEKSLLSDTALLTEKVQGELNTKDPAFFKRRSSGQEILQTAVPRYVGVVMSGQVADVAKTTAFNPFKPTDFCTFCVSPLTGNCDVLRKRYVSRYDEKGDYVQNVNFTFNFSYYYNIPGIMLHPWSTGWLFSSGRSAGVYLIDNDQVTSVRAPAANSILAHASASGHSYVVSSDQYSYCVLQIQTITLDPTDKICFKPFFQIVHPVCIFQLCGFDVSSDETYFALASCPYTQTGSATLSIHMYRTMEPESYAVFKVTLPVDVHDFRSDVCFSMYKGKEMLRYAVAGVNCVYVLDHRNGCAVVNRTEIGLPFCLGRDRQERVWVGCGDINSSKSIVVYST